MLNIRLATLSETYQPKRLDPSKMAAFATKDGKPFGFNNSTQMATNTSLKQTKCESNGLIISDGNEFVKFPKAERELSPNQSSISNHDSLKSRPIVEKPKLELIEDGGHLDQLFLQIRKQKGYYYEEEEFGKAPSINRVSIPEAFTGTKQLKTSTVSHNIAPPYQGYDNVNLYGTELLDRSVIRETLEPTPQHKEKVSSSIKSRSAEGSVKKVSFYDHVNTYNEQGIENVKPISLEETDQVQKMVDLNRNWQEIKIPSVTKETATANARGHINYFKPLNDQPYTPFSRLNKLQPENKVPVDHHKHRSNPSIDVNYLASYDNDLNIIHRNNSGRQNSLYSLISSNNKSSACNSKEGLLLTNKAQFNRRNVGTSLSNDALISSGENEALFNVQLNERRSNLPYEIESSNSNRPTDNSDVKSAPFGLKTVTSENSYRDPVKSRNTLDSNSVRSAQDVPVDTEKQFSTTLESSFAGQLSSKDVSGRNQPSPLTLANTSQRTPTKELSAQPQEVLVNTKTVAKHNKELTTSTKTSSHDTYSETRDFDLRKSYGLLSQAGLTEIPTLSGNVIESQDILNRSLNYNLNMSNFHDSNIGRTSTSEATPVSSLTQTRAFFEQQKGQQKYPAKQETIRKVGKLNIHQGQDARSNYAITERHGAAPSSMSMKMKKQLEDVLGRTPTLQTPIESRKGSTIEINNFPTQRSISGNSQGSTSGTSLMDKVNNDISSMRIDYERSDSGASEGSSRDSIKQELEVLFSGRSQNGVPLPGKASPDSKYNTAVQSPSRNADVDRESSTKGSPRFDSDMILEPNDLSPQAVEFKRAKLPQDLKSLFERKQNNSQNVAARPVLSQQYSKASVISKGEINKQIGDGKQPKPFADFKTNTHDDSSLIPRTLHEPVVSDIRTSSDSLNNIDLINAKASPPVDDSRPTLQSTPKVGGGRKLNIPGLFLASETKEKDPPLSRHVGFKTNKGNKSAVPDSKLPDQGTVLQQRDLVINDSQITLPMNESLPQGSYKNEREGSVLGIEPSKKNNNDFFTNDVHTNQNVDKPVLAASDPPISKPIGKLNMGSFAMFGRNTPSGGTRKISNEKAPKSVDRSYDKLRQNHFQTDEQNSNIPIETHPEPIYTQQQSEIESSLKPVTQTFAENQSLNTIELKNDRPEEIADKHVVIPSKLNPDRTNQWKEPTYASPVSNIRRGKVMIPGAFATNSADTSKKEPMPRVGHEASTSFARNIVNEEKAKSVDISSNNSESVAHDHNFSSLPPLNNSQPLQAESISSSDVTKIREVPINVNLNGQYTDEGIASEEPMRNPKRLAIPNIFSQSQSKLNPVPRRDVKPRHHIEEKTINQSTYEEPVYVSPRPSEIKEEDITTGYKKVGRLAIPNMFNDTSSSHRKPGNASRYSLPKQRDPIATKSNHDVIHSTSFHQDPAHDVTSQGLLQLQNHPGAIQNGSSLQESDVVAESHMSNNQENTNREEEKGGFISPRRGNVNRNQFIGKISVPSVFQ